VPHTGALSCSAPRPRCWQSRLLDIQSGGVSALALAFDDSLLLSAGRDGSLLVTNNGLAADDGSRQAGQPPQLPSLASAGVPEAADLSAAAATFEELKQAASADARAVQAAQAREGLRAEFAALRDELTALLQADRGHLPRSAFTIDPGARRRTNQPP
jgi:hypothetical protein